MGLELADGPDRVTLLLDGVELGIVESYDIQSRVTSAPGSFSIRIGSGRTSRDLQFAAAPGTPFEIKVGTRKIMAGRVDAIDAQQQGDGTTLEVRGRDTIAPLVSSVVQADRSFKEASFDDLTRTVFAVIGLGAPDLFTDPMARRKAITGSGIKKLADPPDPPGTQSDGAKKSAPSKSKVVHKTIKAEIGESWWTFLQRQYKRAGLFLFSTTDGAYQLSQPNALQSPAYRILRQSGMSANAVSVISGTLRDDMTGRYAEYVVYGRTSGGKKGRKKVRGEYIDEETRGIFPERVFVMQDDECKSQVDAEHIARRIAAANGRNGWALTYVVAGHTTPSQSAGGGVAVWAPDTIVEVVDAELGIDGMFYVEAVQYQRSPHTTTTLTLMRPEHLVYAEELFPPAYVAPANSHKYKPRKKAEDFTYPYPAAAPVWADSDSISAGFSGTDDQGRTGGSAGTGAGGRVGTGQALQDQE